jgi:hypothetical protein
LLGVGSGVRACGAFQPCTLAVSQGALRAIHHDQWVAPANLAHAAPPAEQNV